MKKLYILLFALPILLFAACSNADDTPAVISYGENYISEKTYTFLLSLVKSDSVYADRDDDFWETEEGHIAADMLKSEASENAMTLLYYNKIAAENGISASSDEISTVRQQYAQEYDGESGLKKALKKADFSMDDLNAYIKLAVAADKAKRLVHASDGADPLTDADYESYFDAEYMTLRHVFINKTSENAAERADKIENALKNGAELTDFADESDDGILPIYPDGITLPPERELYELANYEQSGSLNLYGLYYYLIYKNPEFYAALTTRPMGEITRVETQDGTFFVQRLTTDRSNYAQYQPVIEASDGVYNVKAAAVVKTAEQAGEFVEDKTAIAAILVRDVKNID